MYGCILTSLPPGKTRPKAAAKLEKRSSSSRSEAGEGGAGEVSTEAASPVPLKKRPRMMEVPYALGHAINQKVGGGTLRTVQSVEG